MIHSHEMGLILVLSCLRSVDSYIGYSKCSLVSYLSQACMKGCGQMKLLSSMQSIVREQNVQSTTHDVGNCY